jgi:hypothetical protein
MKLIHFLKDTVLALKCLYSGLSLTWLDFCTNETDTPLLWPTDPNPKAVWEDI